MLKLVCNVYRSFVFLIEHKSEERSECSQPKKHFYVLKIYNIYETLISSNTKNYNRMLAVLKPLCLPSLLCGIDVDDSARCSETSRESRHRYIWICRSIECSTHIIRCGLHLLRKTILPTLVTKCHLLFVKVINI